MRQHCPRKGRWRSQPALEGLTGGQKRSSRHDWSDPKYGIIILVLVGVDVLTNSQNRIIPCSTSGFPIKQQGKAGAIRESTVEKVFHSFGNDSTRKDIDIRLAPLNGKIHTANKTTFDSNSIIGRKSILLLKYPAARFLCTGLDLKKGDIPSLVKNKDVVTDCGSPLEGNHVTALSEPGGNEKFTG